MVAHKDVALHRRDAVTDGSQQVHLEQQRVARHYFLTELHVVNLHKVGAPTFRFLQCVQYQQTATLGHCLNLQYARHHGLFREVSLEEWLVGCDVLDTNNRVGTKRDNLIHQLHRIAVGQEFANLVHVHYRFLVGVVDGGLDFVLTNLLAHLACKLVVDSMTRTCGNDASLDGFANQGHITNDVQQFVACALILPYQRLVLDISQLCGVAVFYTEHVCQSVKSLLGGLAFVDDDGIVHIAALDEVGLE